MTTLCVNGKSISALWFICKLFVSKYRKKQNQDNGRPSWSMMKENIEIPDDLVITLYSVAFRVEEGEEQELMPSEFAKFIDVTFCVKDKTTGDEIYTEPITYSMN